MRLDLGSVLRAPAAAARSPLSHFLSPRSLQRQARRFRPLCRLPLSPWHRIPVPDSKAALAGAVPGSPPSLATLGATEKG